MKVRIDNREFQIKRLSELSFFEFNEIILKAKAVDLPDYLSVQCNIPVKDLMESELRGISLPSLYAQLFDVNIDDIISDKKKTIEFRDSIRSMSSVSINSFGKSYSFELRSQKVNEDNGSIYELSLHALAIALSDDPEAGDSGEIYKELCSMNWMKVLPQAFFLFKLTKTSRIKRLLLSMTYIGGLRVIRSTMEFCLKRLRELEKK